MHLARLGTVLHMAVAENDTIAQLYDSRVRTYADALAKFREREDDITKLPQEEDRRIKRDGLRECGAAQTFALSTWKPNKAHNGRNKDKGKGKGQDKMVRGKGKDRPSNRQRQKGDGRKNKTSDWGSIWENLGRQKGAAMQTDEGPSDKQLPGHQAEPKNKKKK